MEAPQTVRTGRFDPYVPRVASTWDNVAPDSLWLPIEGSLAFVDISGFTNLSEKLARRGRIGAEELTSVLNRVFGHMLEKVFERGGSLLKFGGDALLLLFEGDDHVMQACAATVEMRAALREAAQEPTSVGRIALKMSSGIHTGPVDFFLVGESHRELLVTGPTASITTDMEGTADASEIVISDAVKALVPKDFVGDRKGSGWLLRKQKINHPPPGPVTRQPIPDDEMARFVSNGLRSYLEAGLSDSEHRIATVGFVKFKGVDALLAEHGPERVGKELDDLVKTVQAAADREGVTFLASDIDADGGKLILTAGVPSSRPDDEGRMLRAARSVLDTELGLKVRVGVNRGHVFSGNVGTRFRRTYTVMGDTVNLAARLMAAAEPGMLYSSPGVLDLSSTQFRTEALEPFYVKGKEKPVQAYSVFESTGVRPPDLKYELPFHGREVERDMIVQIITTCARSGRGGMMTITGDTGLGKTRLVAEVLEECPGLDTLMIQAEPTGADNPYWAFRDPLRRMLGIDRTSQEKMVASLESVVAKRAPSLKWAIPLIGDVMHIEVPDTPETADIDPKFRPDRTADALIELLAKVFTGPFAAIGEDGHWMDDASISLLMRIGEAAKTHPWTVIFTARKERSDFEPLGDEVPLRPLDEDAVRAIVIESTSAAPLRPHELNAVVARAGGNPMFLSAMLGMIRETGSADQLPESLDAVVSTEIDTLPPLTRQILRYTSVLGRSFRRVVLDEFLAPEAVQLDEATQDELTRFIEADGEERMRFRHSVVHDVAYEGLSFKRRRELHARAGQVIERLAGKDPDSVAEFLALHFSESGSYDKVWHYARVAADKAKHAYANTEAATQYRRALEAARNIDEADTKEVSDVWTNLGIVRSLAGQFESARDAFLRALRTDGSDSERRVELHLLRADAWVNSGRLSQAMREITIARKSVADQQDQALRLLSRLDSFEAKVHASKGDPVRASACAATAIDHAGRTKEEEALARAYLVLDWANFMMGISQPQYGEEVVEIYRRLGLLERSAVAMNNLGAYAYFSWDWNESVDWYEQSVEDSDRAGNVIEAAHTRTSIAEILINQRRYEEAAPLIEEADRVLRASNAFSSIPFVDLHSARLAGATGDLESALKTLRRLFTEQIEGRRTEWTGETAISLAEVLVDGGEARRALEVIGELALKDPELAAAHQLGTQRVKASALAELGEMKQAEQILGQALAEAEEAGAIYDELLLREVRDAIRSRVGTKPDPTDADRCAEIRKKLGIQDSLVLAGSSS